jgi:hypothetical protein
MMIQNAISSDVQTIISLTGATHATPHRNGMVFRDEYGTPTAIVFPTVFLDRPCYALDLTGEIAPKIWFGAGLDAAITHFASAIRAA